MGNAMRGLLVCLMAAVGFASYAQDKPRDEKPLPMAKVGERAVDLGGGKERRIPWYRVDVDYNEMRAPRKELVRKVNPDGSVTAYRPLNWWDRVVAPEGTVTAYVGEYGRIRGFRNVGAIHYDWRSWGVDFRLGSRSPVKPGEGNVRVAWWLFEEKPRDDGMMFEESRFYVFCLDRQPVERGKTYGGEPVCEMSDELQHVIAIIEIRPTFDFSKVARTDAPFIATDSLVSFRKTRRGDPRETCSIVRGGNGDLRFETGDGNSMPAKPETVQKLLYALNTAGWHRIEASGETDKLDPTAGIAVEFKGADGEVQQIVEGHVRDQWLLVAPGPAYYATSPPELLMEVTADIRAACANGAGPKDRKE